MSLSRREFLKVVSTLAAGMGSWTASGCSPLAEFLPSTKNGKILDSTQSEWLVLNRLTFGPTASDREAIRTRGIAGWIEDQLSPNEIPDHKTNLLLSRIDTLDYSADQLRAVGDGLFENIHPDRVLDDFRQSALLRKVYSSRQLYEVMVDFWSDHFNISVQKGDCWYLKPVDDREVVRTHALGNFRNLLGASARSPAMMIYLDNQANHREAPNENYARELLELHTLGISGGYTQNDVMELARCLTGWTVKGHFWQGQIRYHPDAHDPGPKSVLGTRIEPTGKTEIDQVLDLLSGHPATAHHLAFKLARRFLGDEPDPEIVERSARTFLQSGGEIKATLRIILLDGLAKENSNLARPKYKRPLQFLAAALRQTGAGTNGKSDLQKHLARMGQPLFAWPTPDGYPDSSPAWQGNLLPRWKFALDLVQNNIPGTVFDLEKYLEDITSSSPGDFLQQTSHCLLGRSLNQKLEENITSALEPTLAENPRQAAEIALAAMLASPAFQWY